MIKYCWIILACLLVGIVVEVIVVKTQPPVYIVSTTLRVDAVSNFSTGISMNQTSQQGTPTSSSPVSLNRVDPLSESVSDVAAIPTRSVMDYIYLSDPQLKAHKITEEEMISGVLAANPSTTSPTILLTITAKSPENAVLIANDIANGFVAYKDKQAQDALNLQRAYLQNRLSQYQAQSSQLEKEILTYTNVNDPHVILLTEDRDFLFKSINTTQAQLAQLRTSVTGGVVIVQQADSSSVTTSSKTLTYTVLFAGGGLLVGLLLWLLLIFLDYRLPNGEQVKEKLGMAYLGILAKNKHIQFGTIPTSGRTAQQLSDIGVNLRLAGVLPELRSIGQGNIVLITSTQPQQGTTTVATGLAAALARSGRSVLVIDGNLRNPGTYKAFGLEATGPGLIALLRAGATAQLDAAVQRTTLPSVWFLPAGAAVDDSAALIEEHMPALLSQVRKKADMIIIDGPPLLSSADAGLLATMVDGVAIVIGRERYDLLLRARAVLKSFTRRPVGIIMNRVWVPKHDAYYATAYSGEPLVEEKLAS
jgi:capsular exopolysaccharide synthesis family protein